MFVGLVLLGALIAPGCSSDCDEDKCEKIAANIRTTARIRGLAEQSVCSNPNAPDFKGACDALRDCNAKCE